MPELPEVEDARQDLEEHVQGKVVATCIPADDEKVLEGCSPAQVKAALEGRAIEKVGRKGKNLWLLLSGGGPHVILHFGMDGELLIRGPDGQTMLRDFKYRAVKKGSAKGDWPPSHCKLLLTFTDGSALAFDEWRRFGRVKLVEGPPEGSEALGKLGFDPLMGMPPLVEFSALLGRRPRAKLKAVLLDQSFAAGVGNWVADEVLYQARLHPEQIVGDMGEQHVAALHAALQSVVRTAVEARADATHYPKGWIFHSRWTNKKAGEVDGRKMLVLTVGGRSSAYVPQLQKLVGGGAGGQAGGGGATKGADAKSGGGAAKGTGEGTAKGPPGAEARANRPAAGGKRGKKGAKAGPEGQEGEPEEQEGEPEEREEVEQAVEGKDGREEGANVQREHSDSEAAGKADDEGDKTAGRRPASRSRSKRGGTAAAVAGRGKGRAQRGGGGTGGGGTGSGGGGTGGSGGVAAKGSAAAAVGGGGQGRKRVASATTQQSWRAAGSDPSAMAATRPSSGIPLHDDISPGRSWHSPLLNSVTGQLTASRGGNQCRCHGGPLHRQLPAATRQAGVRAVFAFFGLVLRPSVVL